MFSNGPSRHRSSSLSVHTCFEAICFDDAFMRSVLARKYVNPAIRCDFHIDCDLVRRCRGRIGTSDPECRRIAVNRIGCWIIVVLTIACTTFQRWDQSGEVLRSHHAERPSGVR